MGLVGGFQAKWRALCRRLYVLRLSYEVHLSLLVIIGYTVLTLGLADSQNALAAGKPSNPDLEFAIGVCKVLSLPEGPWGALVASIAGLIGVISAAFGMYRAALNAIIVCIGAWLIRPLLSMFFMSNLNCGGASAAPPPPKPSGGGGGSTGSASL